MIAPICVNHDHNEHILLLEKLLYLA